MSKLKVDKKKLLSMALGIGIDQFTATEYGGQLPCVKCAFIASTKKYDKATMDQIKKLFWDLVGYVGAPNIGLGPELWRNTKTKLVEILDKYENKLIELTVNYNTFPVGYCVPDKKQSRQLLTAMVKELEKSGTVEFV